MAETPLAPGAHQVLSSLQGETSFAWARGLENTRDQGKAVQEVRDTAQMPAWPITKLSFHLSSLLPSSPSSFSPSSSSFSSSPSSSSSPSYSPSASFPTSSSSSSPSLFLLCSLPPECSWAVRVSQRGHSLPDLIYTAVSPSVLHLTRVGWERGEFHPFTLYHIGLRKCQSTPGPGFCSSR